MDAGWRESDAAGHQLWRVCCNALMQPVLHEKHQFRLALFGHKAVEAGAVCVVLMVGGHVLDVTGAHLLVASKTGVLSVLPSVVLTFTTFARHFVNRWTSSAFFGVCTFVADSFVHASHYPGEYTEAALTAVGAFAFSVAVSYTPLGARIERLADAFLEKAHAGVESV